MDSEAVGAMLVPDIRVGFKKHHVRRVQSGGCGRRKSGEAGAPGGKTGGIAGWQL